MGSHIDSFLHSLNNDTSRQQCGQDTAIKVTSNKCKKRRGSCSNTGAQKGAGSTERSRHWLKWTTLFIKLAPGCCKRSAGAVPGRGSAKAVRPPVPAVDFGNAQEAYRSRQTWELWRSLLVLRLCAWPTLLARHKQDLQSAMCGDFMVGVEWGRERAVGWPGMDTKLEVVALQESVAKMCIASRAEIEDWFTAETLGVTVDLLDWGSLIDSRTKLSKHLVVPNCTGNTSAPR
ncbi:hypothetical protein H8959_006925 [Pygathrix nigripes]